MMKIKIIYETQVGTTKLVAELLKKRLTEQGQEVELHSVLNDGMSPAIEGYDVLLFGSPTYYSGQPEMNIGQLISTFAPDLSKYRVAVFCLGDSNYEHFCGAAEILEEWVTQHRGKLAAPSLKIDGTSYSAAVIDEWLKQVLR
jgi:flavodoxin I